MDLPAATNARARKILYGVWFSVRWRAAVKLGVAQLYVTRLQRVAMQDLIISPQKHEM